MFEDWAMATDPFAVAGPGGRDGDSLDRPEVVSVALRALARFPLAMSAWWLGPRLLRVTIGGCDPDQSCRCFPNKPLTWFRRRPLDVNPHSPVTPKMKWSKTGRIVKINVLVKDFQPW